MELILANSDEEIMACFPAFKELRPTLQAEQFLAQVRRQQSQGYQLLALHTGGQVPSAAGFRVSEFLAWGKVLYIDDLSTMAQARGQGHASAILDWLQAYAQALTCDAIHLDSGYARNTAHRLYLSRGFELSCHHFALNLKAS